ncbi:MAG: hypothetical protein DBO98_02125 [Candidatus Liberibacter europaeus]|nr:hypothetical protein [Candidatus Liberibacter europaeus]
MNSYKYHFLLLNLICISLASCSADDPQTYDANTVLTPPENLNADPQKSQNEKLITHSAKYLLKKYDTEEKINNMSKDEIKEFLDRANSIINKNKNKNKKLSKSINNLILLRDRVLLKDDDST